MHACVRVGAYYVHVGVGVHWGECVCVRCMCIGGGGVCLCGVYVVRVCSVWSGACVMCVCACTFVWGVCVACVVWCGVAWCTVAPV